METDIETIKRQIDGSFGWIGAYLEPVDVDEPAARVELRGLRGRLDGVRAEWERGAIAPIECETMLRRIVQQARFLFQGCGGALARRLAEGIAPPDLPELAD